MYNFSWAALLHVSCYVAPSGSLGAACSFQFPRNLFQTVPAHVGQHGLWCTDNVNLFAHWNQDQVVNISKTIQTCTVDISILVAACIVSLMNVTLFVCLDFCGCVIVAGFDEHTVHFAIFPTWWICV